MGFTKEEYEISSALKAITEKQIGILDQENTNGEGWEYYCNGQIVRAAVLKNQISGTIREFLEEFHVTIQVDEHEIMTSCSCGARNGVCNHIVALLYSWINDQQDFINIGTLIERLHDLEKQDLINLLQRIIEHDPINARFLDNPEYDENDFQLEGLIE
ncbi:MAG TPA: SWIM zinc finger family protein [bacterium]